MFLPANGIEKKLTHLHELLHAAHSPLEAPRDVVFDGITVSSESLQYAEEVRINMILHAKVGLPWLDENLDKERAKRVADFYLQMPPNIALPELIKFALISHPLGELAPTSNEIVRYLIQEMWDEKYTHIKNKYAEALQSEITGILYELRKFLDYSVMRKFAFGEIASWIDYTIPLAKQIQSIKKDEQNRAENIQKYLDAANVTNTSDVPEDLKVLAQKAGFGLSDSVSYKKNQVYDDQPANLEEFLATTDPGRVIWGKAKIDEPKRTVRVPNKFRHRAKNQSSDMGVVPNQIHRALIDGQVFSRRRREPGASVMIDDSGSMSLSSERLQKMMELAPASVIAKYSGSAYNGTITILAKDGTYLEKDQLAINRHGGNAIDLPAIEWLANQPEPRIWITDSAVIPVSGGQVEAAKQCMDFALKHNINVVPNDLEALKIFTGEAGLYR